MKPLNAGLAAHVAGGLTTLCHCWRLERKDGTVMGFTDHDLPLTFDGLTYQAASGFNATAIEDQMGLAVSNLDVAGALSSDAITETDVNAGRYDGAKISVFRVNWADPSQRTVMRMGDLGQVSRGQVGFTAEMRGLAARLEQVAGRIYQRSCPWKLGDARCGVDLSAAGNHGAGAITGVISPFQFKASGLGGIASGRLAYGRLVWTGGPNAGLAMDLAAHTQVAGVVTLTLMLPMGEPLAIGDAFTVTAGCDGSWDTCVGVYANALNFGGFPHMPGDDFALTYAGSSDTLDGSQMSGAGHL